MILMAILLAAVAPDAPLPREAHTFGDWVVACDNTRRCQAVSLVPEGRSEGYNGVLVVERGPEAEAPLELRLAQVEGIPARLVVWRDALPATVTGADGDFAIALQDQPGFLGSAIYGGELILQDSVGADLGKVSLEGLSGAMLYMDEVQGRLHTPSALIRTGRRTDVHLPPVRPVPIIRVAPPTSETPLAIPAARITELRREASCAIGDVGGPDEATTAALGGGRTLVLLACGTGAYNLTIVPFVATREGRAIRIVPAPFDTPLEEWEENEGHRILVNGDWDAQAMTLADFSKGRGLGDCGTRSTYGWDGERFRLAHREEMPECRGSITYVTTWRADIAR